MSKQDTFTLRLETKLLEEARKAALDRGTSLSAFIVAQSMDASPSVSSPPLIVSARMKPIPDA